MRPTLSEQISRIAREIRELDLTHPTRVAVDGFCASGKTTIANFVAEELSAAEVPVIRVTTDDFQHPPGIRWQLGHDSPEGFYRHAIDVAALRTEVLVPLGVGGSRRYRTSTYDIQSLVPKVSEQATAPIDAVLIVDGLFLHVPELRGDFDYTIFVEASFETCISRARRRNQEGKETETEIESLYRRRYVPGFAMYLDELRPSELASVVVFNEEQGQ